MAPQTDARPWVIQVISANVAVFAVLALVQWWVMTHSHAQAEEMRTEYLQGDALLYRQAEIGQIEKRVFDLDERHFDLEDRLALNPDSDRIKREYRKVGLQLENAQNRLKALQEKVQE